MLTNVWESFSPAVLRACLEALESPDAFTSVVATNALSIHLHNLGENAAGDLPGKLGRLLTSRHPWTRAHAAVLIGLTKVGHEGLLDQVSRLASDDTDFVVRAYAVDALYELKRTQRYRATVSLLATHNKVGQRFEGRDAGDSREACIRQLDRVLKAEREEPVEAPYFEQTLEGQEDTDLKFWALYFARRAEARELLPLARRLLDHSDTLVSDAALLLIENLEDED